jgi:hypothetical protein
MLATTLHPANDWSPTRFAASSFGAASVAVPLALIPTERADAPVYIADKALLSPRAPASSVFGDDFSLSRQQFDPRWLFDNRFWLGSAKVHLSKLPPHGRPHCRAQVTTRPSVTLCPRANCPLNNAVHRRDSAQRCSYAVFNSNLLPIYIFAHIHKLPPVFARKLTEYPITHARMSGWQFGPNREFELVARTGSMHRRRPLTHLGRAELMKAIRNHSAQR